MATVHGRSFVLVMTLAAAVWLASTAEAAPAATTADLQPHTHAHISRRRMPLAEPQQLQQQPTPVALKGDDAQSPSSDSTSATHSSAAGAPMATQDPPTSSADDESAAVAAAATYYQPQPLAYVHQKYQEPPVAQPKQYQQKQPLQQQQQQQKQQQWLPHAQKRINLAPKVNSLGNGAAGGNVGDLAVHGSSGSLTTTAAKSHGDKHSRGPQVKKATAQILKKYRLDQPDGSIMWGYENDDGSFKEELIGVDCITKGKFGYTDPDGNRRQFVYETGIKCDRGRQDDGDKSEAAEVADQEGEDEEQLQQHEHGHGVRG